MENTAAVCTGAEQQYIISRSQQRIIWCLFKIWGGRGRKWLASVFIFKREGEALVWGKWALLQVAGLHYPCETQSQGPATGRRGLQCCLNTWWALRRVTKIRILDLQGTLAITLIWPMRKPEPEEDNLLKVNNAGAPVNTIRTLLAHTTSLVTVRCRQHSLKSWISLTVVISHLSL